MLKHAKGNLIDMAEEGLFDVIVHGCNCQHTMGSGIAKEIRARYPGVYTADYVAHRDAGFPMNLLGNYSLSTDTENIFEYKFVIVNAYTQLNYLPRGVDHFEYDSFNLILRKLATIYRGKRFGFPYIGMGLAGGNGFRIQNMLQEFARRVEDTGGSVTLVEFA